MMNEILFFLHIIFVVVFTLAALRLGEGALISLICLESVLANLFVVKQMALFGLNVTCGDVFIVGTFLGLNMLQEYWGEGIAQKTVWISFFVMVFYLIMSQIHIFYMPNSFDKTADMFSGILKFAPRITIVSILVILLMQKLSCYLYSFLNKMFDGRYFFARNVFSILCVQFLDTILFAFFALYGVVGSIVQVMLVSFMIKVVVILISTPFVSLSRKFIGFIRYE